MHEKEAHAFSQEPFRLRFGWGDHAAHDAAVRNDLVVIIDTMDFSTATVTAVAHGAQIFPAHRQPDAEKLARKLHAHLAKTKPEARMSGGFSLSPATMQKAKPGDKIVVNTPNGAFDSQKGRKTSFLIAGTLVNASAAAATIRRILDIYPISCTVVACGERWKGEHEFRPSVEDMIAAGAILHMTRLHTSMSAEAKVCEASWLQLESQFRKLLLDCGSARKHREDGCYEDAEFACQLNKYDAVPLYYGDHFEMFDEKLLEELWHCCPVEKSA